MSTSVTRPEETALFLADRCAELEAENAKLRDLVRWRKCDEEELEKPAVFFWNKGTKYWRPIGPLPGGE